MGNVIYGMKYVRPDLCATMVMDEDKPTLLDKAVSGVLRGLGFAALAVIVVVSAASNPELFGAVFGVTFATAFVGARRG